MSRRIRGWREVADPASEDVAAQVAAQRERLDERLAEVERVVAVGSGKGGVGKSAVTANLAARLAATGRRVGVLDADLNGPSMARMLAASGPLAIGTDGVEPATGAAGARVVSSALLLESPDAPVRWRGGGSDGFLLQSVLESGALREFVGDVAWGPLDVLLIDLPPGTDKLDRAFGLLPGIDLLLLVTTPSALAAEVVGRSARAAREAGVRETAIVANMTAWVCPGCGETGPLWAADGTRELARATGLPVWAEIPFEPGLAAATDAGRPWTVERPDSPAARALAALAERVAGGAS